MFKYSVIFFLLTGVLFFYGGEKNIPESRPEENRVIVENEIKKESADQVWNKNNPALPAGEDIPAIPLPVEEKKEPEKEIKEKPAQNFVLKDILLDIPFMPQAPLAKWNDDRQQDGCEEASVLMVMHWLDKKSLTPISAEQEIIAISEYELKKFGGYHDTDAEDTVLRIINGYYKYSKAEAREINGAEEIKEEILKGRPVIVPVDGQKLKNPHYTPPGPERHNLLIIGYDSKTREFITNDSGTKRGAGYRYPEKTVEAALRDYPTGHEAPMTEIRKTMIVISPE